VPDRRAPQPEHHAGLLGDRVRGSSMPIRPAWPRRNRSSWPVWPTPGHPWSRRPRSGVPAADAATTGHNEW